MPMNGYFITGTDTGVGKTLVGGALARAFNNRGICPGVVKPCETGCPSQENMLVPLDAAFLKRMANCPEDLQHICPYPLRLPLAPAVAAKNEHVDIQLSRIRHIVETFRQRYGVVLVEGAGGLMVPVCDSALTIDLAKMLQLPLIVVGRLGLGTINHTLLTVRQARAGGLDVAGIILNQLTPAAGKAEETNPDVLRALCNVPIVGQMPYIPEVHRNDADYLGRCADRHIEVGSLLMGAGHQPG